jgi:hypothetical protein
MMPIKKSLKEDSMNELIVLLIGKLKETVKQKVQDELKQCQDTTNEKLKSTQKQQNELREDKNKV